MLPFKRDFKATRINRVVNDPSVFVDVATEGQEALDLSPIIHDIRNIVLMCDEGGIVAHWQEPGIFEIHTQFTEKYRGVSAVKTVREMISWLFINSEAWRLQTKIPQSNKAALGLVRAINGRLEFSRDAAWTNLAGNPCPIDYYALDYNDWLYAGSTMGQLAMRGEWFHTLLNEKRTSMLNPPEAHEHDPAHDVNVGATIEMIFSGQVQKALTLYNRWARFAGYAPVRLISERPLLLDIQDSLLLVDTVNKDFEVIECRPTGAAE